MVKKIGELSFPDTLPDVLKDSKLAPHFRNYMRSAQDVEQKMLTFLTTDVDSKRIYDEYLKPGAPNRLRQDPKIQQAAEKLASLPDGGPEGSWDIIRRNMRTRYSQYLTHDVLPKFWRSNIFIDYRNGLALEKAQKEVRSVAGAYGIKDLQLLTKLLTWINIGQLNKMKACAIDVMKKEEIKMKPLDFAFAVRDGKRLDALADSQRSDKSDNADKVDVSDRALKNAYFEKRSDRKLQGLVKDMALAILDDNDAAALVALNKIKKIEPPKSFAASADLKGMKKMLKSAKVVRG